MPTREKISKHKKIKNLFYLTLILTFLAIDLSLGLFVIRWQTPLSILLFVILSIFLYSFSLKFTKKLFSLFLKPYKIYKLHSRLTTKPKVAILYSTMNDVLPECLSIINQSYPCDVFVLDDSSQPEKRMIVDKISKQKGYTVLRRSERKGFKAGAIDNWINLYGKNYDYIVLLDSDSFIPKDWVKNALLYAENPWNSNVAVFQGLINIWNLDNKFIKTLTSLHKIGQDTWELKLANYLDAVLCYGHNVLIRMKPVLQIGGFVEGYVSEDFATAVKLAENGYKCRFIPLHTYEAMPENIRGFIKRQHKWTRGSMEFLSFIKNSSLTLGQKVLLSSIPLGHFSYIGILVAMLLTVFGYATTFDNFYGFLQNLITYNIFFIWSIPIFRFALVISLISSIVNITMFRKLKIGFYKYWRHEILSKAIGAIMLPYEVLSIARYLINRKLQFPVTPKHEEKLHFNDILSIAKITLILSIIFIIGLWFVNPLGFIFNLNWLIPFTLAPLTIYLYSNDKITKSELVNDGGNFSDRGIISGASQTREVYSYIRKKRSPIIDFDFSEKNKKIILIVLAAIIASLAGIFLYNSITGFFVFKPFISEPTNIPICGNSICEVNEDSTNCPIDCPETAGPTYLIDGIKITDPAAIGPHSNPNEIYVNDIVKLQVYAEELNGDLAYKAWVVVKSPSGTIETIELKSGSAWSGSTKVKENGIYQVTFTAIDESSMYTGTATIEFTARVFYGVGIPSAGIAPSAY